MHPIACSRTLLLLAAGVAALPGAEGDERQPLPVTPLPSIVVEGRQDSLVGIAASASEGTTGREQLQWRPILRPAELLETVPGMIATQHSGTGKANQYFLRGFNLDHGTDFATWVDGMPVNMPTHGHGQGYSDVNFLIPELVANVTYFKGPYTADIGDFSSAGGARIALVDVLPANTIGVIGGSHGYGRALATGSPMLGDDRLVYGIDVTAYAGPWDHDEDLRKGSGVARYIHGDRLAGWSITAMAYAAEWDSTDQIPARAVERGEISRLGTIDATDGGRSSRFSLSGSWHVGDATQLTTVSAYAIAYRMQLWSNFTFLLDDPNGFGDQFEQYDRRTIIGGEVRHRWLAHIGGIEADSTVGLQVRDDIIPQVALYQTHERNRDATVRSDEVNEGSLGIFATTTLTLTDWLRATPGLRGDLYRFDVTSDNPANSGTRNAGIVSPKLQLAFGPWEKTDFYLGGGYGLHSNDARGTTITVDPADGVTPAERVDPLVRSKGAEVGVRSSAVPGLNTTLALWVLRLDSELLFVGDAGSTEASRPSERVGVEWANHWRAMPWLDLDVDYAWTKARFANDDPTGEHIPGAPEQVASAGITVHADGWFASLRLRWFGPRPLIEDDSVRSESTMTLNAGGGYTWKQFTFSLEVLNLTDSKDHDVDYWYESQIASDGGPTTDLHYHPVEPLSVRGGVTWAF